MKVLILTSSTSSIVFDSLCENANFKPNPSNQNFYNKLIKAISYFSDISVVSHRPFARGMYHATTLSEFEDKEIGINYYYTKIRGDYVYKLLFEKKYIYRQALKAINEFNLNDIVVVVDPLRKNLLNVSLKLKNRFHFPVIGMLTDNPNNLSKTTRKFSNSIIAKTHKLDGFLSLTEGLLNAYGVSGKPSYIFEGLVEEIDQYKKEPLGNYFAFAGSINERFGVKNLVEAFSKLDCNYNLVILGTGSLEKYISAKIKTDSRILYLSQLSKEKVYAIEQHAAANINPRPFDRIMDKESVPSKMFEYLASGVPTISTIHTGLKELFANDVFWIEDDSSEGIYKALSEFMKETPSHLNKKASTAKVKVYEMFGLRPQGEGITHFLASFKTVSK